MHKVFWALLTVAILVSFSPAGRIKVNPYRESTGTPAMTLAGAAGGIDGMVQALRAGNAEQLARFFDAYVDISLPDRQGLSYSRSQALMVLRDFFRTYRVKDFDILVQGDGSTSNYCIGTLRTNSGSFRTTLFISQVNPPRAGDSASAGETPDFRIKEIQLVSR